jgi:hypothetical protein
MLFPMLSSSKIKVADSPDFSMNMWRRFIQEIEK